MPKIKFSHEYTKMPFEAWIPNTKLKAKLLEVFIAEKKDLCREFIEYDTSYFERILDGEDSHLEKKNYPLPYGKLLVLLLQTSNSTGFHLWTTVRRWRPEKEKYYSSLRGQIFDCIIEKEDRIC